MVREWVLARVGTENSVVYRNCFAQTSHVVCMVTKLKVLEFLLDIEFSNACA